MRKESSLPEASGFKFLTICNRFLVATSSLPEASGFKSSFVCDLNVIYSSSLPEASGFKLLLAIVQIPE